MNRPHTRRAGRRSAKANALSRFLSGDARALQALHAPDYPRDPVTGEYDYGRMSDEQLTRLIAECRAKMTDEERAMCHPNSFRDMKELTDEELTELIEWDKAQLNEGINRRIEALRNPIYTP